LGDRLVWQVLRKLQKYPTLTLAQNGLGHIFGYFFENLFGYPGSTTSHFLAWPVRAIISFMKMASMYCDTGLPDFY
jgi:hypothetical protein